MQDVCLFGQENRTIAGVKPVSDSGRRIFPRLGRISTIPQSVWLILTVLSANRVRGSEISLGQGGVQRYLWVREGFRDIFGSGRGSEISLGQ